MNLKTLKTQRAGVVHACSKRSKYLFFFGVRVGVKLMENKIEVKVEVGQLSSIFRILLTTFFLSWE